MSTRSRVAALTGAVLIAATSVGSVLASSHREAPLIAGDPAADNTDLYAFLNPTDPTRLTIIANYVPLEEPAGGPNFFPFDPTVRYEINIDNNGDGVADVTYRFAFNTRSTAKNFAGIPTFLYNDGPVTSLTDPNLLAEADLRRPAQRHEADQLGRNAPHAAGQRRSALDPELRDDRGQGRLHA